MNFKNAYKAPTIPISGKNLHYASDGTGRDSYIVINEGGLSKGFN